MRFRLTGATTLLAVLAIAGAAHAQSAGTLTAQDHADIQQLYARYNEAIDSGDAEGYAATFTADGIFNNNYKGKEGLLNFMQQWTTKMNGGSRRHWNTNLLITPTAEGATGSVYLMLLDVSQRPPVIASTAKYSDTLVKTPQGWRFKTRATRGDAPPRPAAPAAAPGAPQQ
jgi:hypothetical protein